MSKGTIAAIGICAVLLLAIALIVGAQGPASAQDAADPIPPETCVICHSDAGSEHQAFYDELYQDGAIQVTDLAYEYSAPDTHIVTWQMTKDGAPFDASKAEQVRIYFAPYTGDAFQFEPAVERLALTGELSYDGEGGNTSTLTDSDPAYANDFGTVDGLIVLYGRDETQGRLPARVYQAKYPFAAILETGDGVDYASAANNAGCEKCHTVPYLKHGYIYAQIDGDPATDFYTCKACHLDNTEGGHLEWQLLVNDPEKAIEYLESDEDLSIFTPEELEMYAYTPSLMNDVHMSHAMEFPYPQSMANCVTCHEGKLDAVLSDESFTVETCKSCHPVTGYEDLDEDGEPTSHDTTQFALANIVPPEIHGSMDLATTDCTTCHGEGKAAGGFGEIHSGYVGMIYADADLKYSDVISVTIDAASVDDNKVTVQFSAVEDPDVEGLDVADIVPTVLVGMYGWDTKDFIIGAHERLVDDNGDGEISRASGDERALEYEVGAEHPRAETVSAEDGSWEVVMDMSTWADLIDDGTVRRLELAVIPTLEDADGATLALDATSRTFDLGANDFDDDFYGPIADVDKCHNCHDALATNYHSPDRGGSIVVCRMCHITKSRGSHLELQSRSLDSYIHGIHSGQAFDVGDIDFSDPVAALHYDHHIHFPYPTHGTEYCESCHLEGTYDMPDQTKSLPGAQSATDSNETWDRNIGEVPLYITGPGARACGGCHRAELINEDAPGELIPLLEHMKQGGYQIEGGEDYPAVLGEVINEIMALFGQ
jgi:OmcA/MtrC family decaheme c-type cytochrome